MAETASGSDRLCAVASQARFYPYQDSQQMPAHAFINQFAGVKYYGSHSRLLRESFAGNRFSE
jgi:hypothetical protein